MLTLFSNAFEALDKVSAEQRALSLRTVTGDGQPSQVMISLKNTHSFFSEEALRNQGKKIAASRHGLGLGLLLVNRMIEQVGGKLKLENLKDGAMATIALPGERA
jgi:nitrogen fixation/metabolism regulation signal transduction histidine kinase